MPDPTRISLAADPHTRLLSGVTIHGRHEFSVPFITEIAENLWQGGCADGLVLPESFRHLVSLYPWESYAVRHELASAVTVQMLDDTDQELAQIGILAEWVRCCRETGPVLIHCQAGLNRSSLVTARVLMLGGMPAEKAIALIREKRSPVCLCNPAFEDWLLSSRSAPRLRLEDYRLLYTRAGKRAHLSGPYAPMGALCRVMPSWPDEWLGTGSQREYEKAASLPLCRECEARFGAALAKGGVA